MHLPDSMTAKSAMSIGTAGYTAALCALALMRHGLKPGEGEVLVTGANGGVGGFAIRLLAAKGYVVVASSGRLEQRDRLLALGAAEVIDRETLAKPGKPLQKERWAGVIDSVGSHTLANACAATRYRGVVTACGLAQGMDFPATVAPFILRGITLVGIDSGYAPFSERNEAWKLLGETLDAAAIQSMSTREITLEDAIGASDDLLEGRILGRVVVRLR
jgi:acrylyl-CoA reductase (NADPH)